MSDGSTIEWTEATWNPVRGCVKVSPGRKHCYAETFAERWRGVPGHAYERGFDPRLVPEKLAEPLRWKRGRRVFVNSMSDIFADFVPFEYRAACFAVMAATPQHSYQVLTKRDPRPFFALLDHETAEDPLWVILNEHARAYGIEGEGEAPGPLVDDIGGLPLDNVWMGVSVEDRKYGLPRIDWLREVPAAVRFLSIEPLLEDLGEIDLTGIGWVIVGGESGAGARQMRPEWARSIREQCAAAGVPFFFKQWGGLNKKKAGRVLDGRTYDEYPGVP